MGSSHRNGQKWLVTWKSFASHAYLPGVLPDQQHEEILKSKEFLERKIGRSVDYFSYPVGGFNKQIIEFVQRAGYQAAFTTNRGYNRYNKDVYSLKRIRLSDKDNSDMILWFKLSGFYNFLRAENPSDKSISAFLTIHTTAIITYSFDYQGFFVIKNFIREKAFIIFFPGIPGLGDRCGSFMSTAASVFRVSGYKGKTNPS